MFYSREGESRRSVSSLPLCSTQAFSDLGGAAVEGVTVWFLDVLKASLLVWCYGSGRGSFERWDLVKDIQVVRNLHLKRVFEFWSLLHSAFFGFLGMK